MRRLAVLLCPALLVGAVLAGPVQRRDPLIGKARPTLEAYSGATVTDEFRGGERAGVVVSGNGSTQMGLYVYDEHGNCVGSDDQGGQGVYDDLAVVWFPPRTARYTIEVRNLGPLPNTFELALR
jgi:hypothetical protein